MGGGAGIVADLLPEIADMGVDGAVEGVALAAFDAIEQQVAGEDPARLGGEFGQKVEFGAGQIQRLSVKGSGAPCGVDLERAVLGRFRLCAGDRKSVV